ncbi:hypothetical protein [Streptomyces sp. NPDC012510]
MLDGLSVAPGDAAATLMGERTRRRTVEMIDSYETVVPGLDNGWRRGPL